MSVQPSPFSARNPGQHQKIDNDFPVGARTGIEHLLWDLVERKYVTGWSSIARELQRIARKDPVEYGENGFDVERAKMDAASTLRSLKWENVYDFCERLYGHLAREVSSWDEDWDTWRINNELSEVRLYIGAELQRIFDEDRLAYEFADGVVRRRGRKHTEDQATRAGVVLGDGRLADARDHYNKALKFFRDRTKPDFQNSVKEAVCAVEAAGKALFPNSKAKTLGDLVKDLGNKNQMPQALLKTLEGIYAYRNSGDGVSHGGANGGAATEAVTEYVLSVCASQIIFLVDLADRDEIPF